MRTSLNNTEVDPAPVSAAAPSQVKPHSQESVVRSAGIVSLAVFMSRVTGLMREIVMARLFGAGLIQDAFYLGFRIPNLTRDLFAEVIRLHAPKPQTILLFRTESHLLAYHLGSPLHTLVEWGELKEALAANGPHVVVMPPE